MKMTKDRISNWIWKETGEKLSASQWKDGSQKGWFQWMDDSTKKNLCRMNRQNRKPMSKMDSKGMMGGKSSKEINIDSQNSHFSILNKWDKNHDVAMIKEHI